MKYNNVFIFFTVDEDNYVNGYSSSTFNAEEIIYPISSLPEHFKDRFRYFKYDRKHNIFLFDEEKWNNRKNVTRYTDFQKLYQSDSETKITLYLLQKKLRSNPKINIKNWKERYDNKWATLEQVKMLYLNKLISPKEYQYIIRNKNS